MKTLFKTIRKEYYYKSYRFIFCFYISKSISGIGCLLDTQRMQTGYCKQIAIFEFKLLFINLWVTIDKTNERHN